MAGPESVLLLIQLFAQVGDVHMNSYYVRFGIFLVLSQSWPVSGPIFLVD